MKARLREIISAEDHSKEIKQPTEVCKVLIDIQTKSGSLDNWHGEALTIYTSTVQEGARIGLACVDAINALKDEEKMR